MRSPAKCSTPFSMATTPTRSSSWMSWIRPPRTGSSTPSARSTSCSRWRPRRASSTNSSKYRSTPRARSGSRPRTTPRACPTRCSTGSRSTRSTRPTPKARHASRSRSTATSAAPTTGASSSPRCYPPPRSSGWRRCRRARCAARSTPRSAMPRSPGAAKSASTTSAKGAPGNRASASRSKRAVARRRSRRSRGAARAFSQPLLHPGPHGLERTGQLVGVGPARLRHVGTPAAFPADLLGDVVHQLSGFHLAGEVGRDAGDERNLAVVDGAKDDRCRLEPSLELVERLAQRLRVRAIHRCSKNIGAFDADRLRGEIDALPGGELELEARQLLLEGSLLFEHAYERLLRHAGAGLRAQLARHVAELVQLRVHHRERGEAGGRLDAPDAGRDAALRIDFEHADIAGAGDVRPSAELAGGADIEDSHLIAVFLAEQHHGAGALRLLDRHHLRASRRVLEDLRVDASLDLADLRLGHRLVVREVEARLVRVDQRAALLHVRPEHFAQRLVHQVRHRMVAHGALAQRRIDARVDAIADLERAALEGAVMAEDVGLDLLRVVHGESARRPDQLAAVADLPAGLGIERRLVEDHGTGVAAF